MWLLFDNADSDFNGFFFTDFFFDIDNFKSGDTPTSPKILLGLVAKAYGFPPLLSLEPSANARACALCTFLDVRREDEDPTNVLRASLNGVDICSSVSNILFATSVVAIGVDLFKIRPLWFPGATAAFPNCRVRGFERGLAYPPV